jgi:hypothetical protein
MEMISAFTMDALAAGSGIQEHTNPPAARHG